MNEQIENTTPSKWKLWLKRIGLLGFLFFLIKGLIWIGVFLFVGKELLD